MKRLILGLFVLVMSLLLSLLSNQEAFASFIYWTANYGGGDGMRIQRTGDGTGVTDLFSPVCATGIALDITGGKMYWSDLKYYAYHPYNGRILRANMDGTEVEYLFTDLIHSKGVALDTASGDIYWTSPNGGEVQRGNMDGTGNVEDLVAEVGSPSGIALDTAASKMYWTDTYTQKIRRANMDGTEVEDLFTLPSGQPVGIALDTASSKIYWTDGWNQQIQFGNMDGTGAVEFLFPGIAKPDYGDNGVAITLDTASGKIYWAEKDKILRGNIDGTGEVETIVSGLGGGGYGTIMGIALQIDGTPLIPHHGSSPEPIPEPTTIVLMGFGLLGVLGVVIRQRRKVK